MVPYFNLTVVAEWLTFITALIFLDKRTGNWRYFTVLFFLVLLAETSGWLMIVKWKIYNNALPFNILMLTSITFFTCFLRQYIISTRLKSWLIIAMTLFVMFGLGNLFLFQGLSSYNAYTEAIGDIMLALLCCHLLLNLVKDVRHINLLQLDYFWLIIGILFNSLGSALLYQFSDLLDNYRKETGINIGNYLNYSINILLSTSFIIAFICRRKATR